MNRHTPIYYAPGQKISTGFLAQLKQINAAYAATNDFKKYVYEIEQFFKIAPVDVVTTDHLFFLAGFLEGEGSLHVSMKGKKESRFGHYIEPAFSATQYINGISNLYLLLLVMQTGRIEWKNGSNATFGFTFTNRELLETRVLPFYKAYVFLFGSSAKILKARKFEKLLVLFKEGACQDLNRTLFEVLPLWQDLRVHHVRNQAFASLKEAQDSFKKVAFQKRGELSNATLVDTLPQIPVTSNITLKSGEVISAETVNTLKTLSKEYTQDENFTKYLNSLCELFQYKPEEFKPGELNFLGGYTEGEGGLVTTVSKSESAPFGIKFSLSFAVSQHLNGFSILYKFIRYLAEGRLFWNSTSNANLVFNITKPEDLMDKVFPFFDNYVNLFGSPIQKQRKADFQKLLFLLFSVKSQDFNCIYNEILPLWDSLRKNKGYKNETFKSLEEAQAYIISRKPR